MNSFFRCERHLIRYEVYKYEYVREYSIYEVDLTDNFLTFLPQNIYISMFFCYSKESCASFLTENAVLMLNNFIIVSISLWLVIHGQ